MNEGLKQQTSYSTGRMLEVQVKGFGELGEGFGRNSFRGGP